MVLGMRITHGRHRGSVLPQPATLRAREGTQLVAGPPRKSELALVIYLLAITLVLAGLAIAGGLARGGRAIGGLVMMIGPLTLYGGQYLRQRRLRSATLTIHPWPLRLGSEVTVHFKKRLKAKARIENLTARLVCIEETQRSSGRDVTTKKNERYAIDLDTSGAIVAPGVAQAEWFFTIPADGLPSLKVKSNRVAWVVETRTKTGGSDVAADFELVVRPEVAS